MEFIDLIKPKSEKCEVNLFWIALIKLCPSSITSIESKGKFGDSLETSLQRSEWLIIIISELSTSFIILL